MKVLVTGAGGFLGGALARLLRAKGLHVRAYVRRDSLELEKEGFELFKGDICDERALRRACAGCGAVFHAAAKVGIWGKREEYVRANVEGTRNTVNACLGENVPRLVFTSSPSVVFDGRDCYGWNESVGYPAHFDSFYSESKAAAERLVLAANSPRLSTVSLRPHLMWGPGNDKLVSGIISRGAKGRLRMIGGMNKPVDTTYIEDAAEAHYMAAIKLDDGSAARGKAYFISQGDPRPVWEIVNSILDCAGLPHVQKNLSLNTAKTLARLCELAYSMFAPSVEPPLTRFVVGELTTAHWFDISAARRDLDYKPRHAIEHGMRELKKWLVAQQQQKLQ